MNPKLAKFAMDASNSTPDDAIYIEGFNKGLMLAEDVLLDQDTADFFYKWITSGTYLSLIHRHDGTFRAVDESNGHSWNADGLDDLKQLIEFNPTPPRVNEVPRSLRVSILKPTEGLNGAVIGADDAQGRTVFIMCDAGQFTRVELLKLRDKIIAKVNGV